jgi:hypothetical protein
MEGKRNSCQILAGKPKEKGSLRKPRLGWILILKWILEKENWAYGLD